MILIRHHQILERVHVPRFALWMNCIIHFELIITEDCAVQFSKQGRNQRGGPGGPGPPCKKLGPPCKSLLFIEFVYYNTFICIKLIGNKTYLL